MTESITTPRTLHGAAGTTEADARELLFAGPGEMRARCRALNWEETPLGPVALWPQSLRTLVSTLLATRNPMFLWWGPQLVQVYNDAYRPSLGDAGRHPRALGATGREFWTDIWESIGPEIEQVLRGGDSTWHVDQYLPIERNGRLEDVWWTYSYSAVRDDDGAIAGVLVVCLETTERVRAEQERQRLFGALELERARLEQVFRRAPTFIVAFRGPEQRYEFVNEAYYQLIGHRDVVGKPLLEAIPEIREQGFKELLDRVRETGEPWVGRETPVLLQRTPGAPLETRYLDMVFQALAEADGTRSGVVAHGSDVTEQVYARREAERARAEVSATLESISDAFYAVDADFCFTYVNRKAEQLWGRRREDLIGKSLVAEFPKSAGTESFRMHEQVLKERRPAHYEAISPLLGRWMDVSVYPAEGGGLSCYFRDIHDRKAAEEEREQLLAAERSARRDAEAANRTKSEFLAVMSHELRTPLNAIGGYAELLEMGIRGPITPQQREDLARIQTSQRHLLGLINEVLNYAKLETGSVRYDLTDVPVCDALADAEGLVAPQARAKGLPLRVAHCDTDVHVRADAEKLRQVLVNLLSNAVKFTHGGGIDVELRVAQESVAFEVRDTGIGIPPDKLEAIFEPFVQVRADLTRTAEGTGLGLAISRDLARGMGGDLTVASELGRGSTFTLIVPRG